MIRLREDGWIMATLLSSERTESDSDRSDIQLTATVPADDPGRTRRDGPELVGGPRLGWIILAVGGALASALAGWILVAGLAVVGWVTAGPGDLATTLRVGTRLWLLSNGAAIRLGGLSWSVVPLGMSLLFAYMFSRSARLAVRYAQRTRPTAGRELRYALNASALMIGCYVVVTVAVAVVLGVEPGRLALGAALIAAGGALWGSCRGLDARIVRRWPGWLQPVPYAVATAMAILLVGGLAALGTGIWIHTDRITDLAGGLGAGVVGGIGLWAAQAAFLPNAVVWSASYALGAGFTLGPHTVVGPAEVKVGLMPAIPMLGALPGGGVGNWLNLLWLVTGVLAGAGAAWQVLRRRPRARVDQTCLVGGLAGVLAAVVFVAVAWVTGGSLGDQRLSGVGPRLLESLVMGGTLLGLSGMTFGLVAGLFQRARRVDTGTEETDPAA